LNSFKLPIFLKINENATNNLIFKLEKEFSNIRDKKVIFFTSKKIYSLFKNKINRFVKNHDKLTVFYVDNSSYDIAVKVAKKISIEDYEYIIGFGGGKILDTAKYSSYVSKKTFISIPTTLSNDGLASPIAVLKTKEGKAKSFGCKSPDGIIIDTNIIKNTPKRLLIAGIGDTLSNYSALFDWKLDCRTNNNKANDFAYLLSETALNMLLFSKESDIHSKNFIKELAQSLVLSGLAMEIAGNSRPCSGSEHLFSHSLDEHHDLAISHGLQVALGSVVSCILQDRDKKILIDFLNKYEVNISPKALGISKDVFIESWLKAQETRPDRYTILNEIKLDKNILEEIYINIMEVL